MASLSLIQAPNISGPVVALANSATRSLSHPLRLSGFSKSRVSSQNSSSLGLKKRVGRGRPGVVCAAGDVSAAGTNYLIAGAVAIALIGTALPVLFSRKDLCPDCDGAGFIRAPNSGALKANAARKDLAQIVCKRCNGLGKIGQIDKV